MHCGVPYYWSQADRAALSQRIGHNHGISSDSDLDKGRTRMGLERVESPNPDIIVGSSFAVLHLPQRNFPAPVQSTKPVSFFFIQNEKLILQGHMLGTSPCVSQSCQMGV